jgi:DNA-binding beta-propeller fold protein YncE
MEWRIAVRAAAVAALAAGLAACASAPGGDPGAAGVPGSAPTYRVYIANESSDAVSRVAFTPGAGAVVEARTPVGMMIADIDGPHGITVSPDGDFWYVSLAHGTPFGRVLKYATAGDTIVGRVELGHFPASMAATPDGEFLYVVNFNLYGEMVPSSVSIVHTPTMLEVARPTTCVMPHGSRINAAGTRQYSVCMMNDQLVEIDTRTFEVSARFNLMPGHEGPLAADDVAGHGMHHGGDANVCSPTWAVPGVGPSARFVYVPCNARGEIVEIDMEAGRLTRRFETGRGPYNLAVTPDGRRVVATLKADQGVAVFDLASGRELARIATSRPITHGVVISPDGRYAFITNEAIGSTRGTLDVIDLAALRIAATVELDHQPGGIDFWHMAPGGTAAAGATAPRR